MLLHPNAKTCVIIGLGTGMSAKALATFQFGQIDRSHRDRAGDDRSEQVFQPGVGEDWKSSPPGVNFPADGAKSRVWYDPAKETALLQRSDGRRRRAPRLMNLSEDRDYRGAIDTLYRATPATPVIRVCSKTSGCG